MLTVSTDAGGKIAIDLAGGADAGVYTYTPPIDITTLTEFFTYNLIDGDGDTAGNTFTITIDSATRPMVVRDDFVVTNQSSIIIPDWALLANDSGPNSSTQAITAVSPASGDVPDTERAYTTHERWFGGFKRGRPVGADCLRSQDQCADGTTIPST